MRILQLTKKFPFPLDNGEAIAIYNLVKGLKASGASVDLLALNTSKHYADLEHLPTDFDHYDSVYAVYHDNAVKYFGALKNLLTSESYHVERLYSKTYEDKLANLLENNDYDVVLLETVYLAMYVPIVKRMSNAKICLRAHNVEYEIWHRCSIEEDNRAKAWYLKLCADRLKKFEIKHLQDYDLLVSISDRDLVNFEALGYTGKALSIPVGVDVVNYVNDSNNVSFSDNLCFIGSLDWMPNMQGLQWFLSNVWSDLSVQFPNLKFHIAGKNAPASFDISRYTNVIFHGAVDCATEFMSNHGTLVVPLLSGSGIRVKIIEAMALGIPVITTSIGLEGIHTQHGHDVLIANTKAEFVTAYTEYKDDLAQIGVNGKQYIIQHFDANVLGSKLYAGLSQLIELSTITSRIL